MFNTKTERKSEYIQTMKYVLTTFSYHSQLEKIATSIARLKSTNRISPTATRSSGEIMIRQYYYLANVAEGFGATKFWDYVVKAENSEKAKKLYSEEYNKMFGHNPVAVVVKRTNKATYEDINNREF